MPSDALSKSITERRRSKFTHSRETPQLAIEAAMLLVGFNSIPATAAKSGFPSLDAHAVSFPAPFLIASPIGQHLAPLAEASESALSPDPTDCVCSRLTCYSERAS